jgi:VCBS repeat-containing protein
MAAFIGLDDTPTYTENGGLTVLDDDATIGSAASYDGAILTLARDGGANPNDVFDGSGTLSLSDGQVLLQEIEDQSSEPIDIIVGTYTNSDGALVITFNADATGGRVNAVLEQIVYGYGGEAPPPTAQIDYAFDDGQSPVATGSITVTLVGENDPPSLDSLTPTAAYRPGSPGVVLSPSLVINDLDSTTLAGAVVQIVDRPDEPLIPETSTDTPDADDVLSADPGATGIDVLYNPATHALTLSGTATLDQYRQVLATVAYSSTDADPSQGGASTTRSITWQLDDGGRDHNLSTVQTTVLHFIPSLDLDGSAAGDGFATAYTENDPAVPIADTDAVVTNPAGNLTFATITLTNAKPGDSLAIGALPGGITGTVDTTSVPGQIIVGLGGAASPANYQAALRQVVFGSSSENPHTTPRDITVVVGDETESSNTAHTTIAVTAVNDAPVAQAGSASGNEDTTIFGNAVATDADNSAAQLTYSLVGVNGGATHGTVALNPDGSFTYAPAADFNGTDSFSFKANDGALDSNTASVAITVGPVNDAPVLGGDDAITVAEGGTVAVTTADLTASDVDNGAAELVYTVTSTSHGSVLKSGAAAASFTQADLAASLVSFSHDGSELDGSFTVSLTDGTAAPQGATVTATVSPHVNDAPVLSGDDAITVVNGGAVVVTTADLTASDPDNTPAELVYTVTGATHGVIRRSGAATASFTQADLAANLVSFQHDGSGAAGGFTVSLSDGGAPAQTATVTATVSSGLAPTDITGGPLAIAENSPDGALVGTVTGQDPDGQPLAYTLTDNGGGRFAIDNAGNITVANGILLDFEQAPGHIIVARVTDIDGLSFDKAFTVAVGDLEPEVAIGGPGPDTLFAGAAADTLNGGGGDDVLLGGGGNDYLVGGGGNDKLFGEAGNDTVIGADGNDYLNGGADDDLIVGNGGADTLLGDSGNDYLDGGDGADLLFGGSGTDTVLGAGGDDYVNGGAGDDLVFGGDGTDTLLGEDGNDYLNGENGNDIIFAHDGNDTVIGGDGDDYLSAGAGDDVLVGGNGNDTLFAGSGSDYLKGDAGDDRFIFDATFQTSLVIDFTPGAGPVGHDVIQFATATFANFADAMAHAVQDGTNTIFTDAGGHTLTLANVLKTSLVTEDFTFV